MFDRAGEYVLARTSGGAHDAEDCHVVRFGAAAGENNLARVRANQRRHLPARGFQTLFRGLPEMMDARGVTIHLTQTRHRCLHDFGSDRGGGVVVEIEMLHLMLVYQ